MSKFVICNMADECDNEYCKGQDVHEKTHYCDTVCEYLSQDVECIPYVEKSCETCGDSSDCARFACPRHNFANWTPKQEKKDMKNRPCDNKNCPCGFRDEGEPSNCRVRTAKYLTDCPSYTPEPVKKEWVIRVPEGVEFSVNYKSNNGSLISWTGLKTLHINCSCTDETIAKDLGITCELVEKE